LYIIYVVDIVDRCFDKSLAVEVHPEIKDKYFYQLDRPTYRQHAQAMWAITPKLTLC